MGLGFGDKHRQARLPIKNKSASSSDSDFCGKGHGKSGVPAALHKAPIFPTGKEGQQEDMPSSCLKLKIPTGLGPGLYFRSQIYIHSDLVWGSYGASMYLGTFAGGFE